MTLGIKFSKSASKDAGTAVSFAFLDGTLSPSVKHLDRQIKGFIATALGRDKKFTGKLGEFKLLTLPQGAGFDQILLTGLGNAQDLDLIKAGNTGGKIYAALESAGVKRAAILNDDLTGVKAIKAADFFAHLAYGAQLRAYKFLKYRTVKDREPKRLERLEILHPAAAKNFAALDAIAQGVYFARDLVNEPPNYLYPDTFAKRISSLLAPLGVDIDIIDEKKMARLGMGAALGVGQGSDFPPRMVVMRWNGGLKKKGVKDGTGPLAFVGKGITFDTGGVSIKPAAGMEEMKMDMGGAAAVAGLMLSLALNKSKANVVGIVALAENALSGRAYRPSDILKSHSGKTIEVLNTDAEGRLVLADALSYVQKEYKPRLIIDLATLTGAMMVALGHEYCGAFVNDNDLWAKLESASAASGEKLWRMPLDEAWKKEMEGTIADLQNIAKGGRNAGACTAAGFLEHFIENGTPWAHLDIAGVAWVKSDKPTVPKYGTGYGVRLLHNFVQDNFQ